METTAVIYRIVLLGHIGAAIIGLGALVTNSSLHAKAVRSSITDAVPVLRATGQSAKLAEFGLYGVLAFGIVLIALSDDVYRYSEPWISAAFVVWLLIIGLTHALVRPARSRLLEMANGFDAASDADRIGLIDREETRPILTRLAIGEAATQLLLVASLALMIWKPGH